MFRQKGFTLIELLVVIAIISLLSTIALSALRNSREKAQYTQVVAELQQVEKAFYQVYLERGGCWPRENNARCGGYASAAPTVSTLLSNSAFGLSKYISAAPSWPFDASVEWQYDNDGDNIPADCASVSGAGVNVTIIANNAHYRVLNSIIDGDGNPDDLVARACGKIRYNGASNMIFYTISHTQ